MRTLTGSPAMVFLAAAWLATAAVLWHPWGAYLMAVTWPDGLQAHEPWLKWLGLGLLAWTTATARPATAPARPPWFTVAVAAALCATVAVHAGLGMFRLGLALWWGALWLLVGQWAGTKAFVRAWPAVALLLMAIPGGWGPLLDTGYLLTPALATFTANGAATLLRMLGMEVYLEGFTLLLRGATVNITPLCAGTQYLEVFTTLALVRLFLHGRPRWLPAWPVFLLSTGLALNTLRVSLFAWVLSGGYTGDTFSLDLHLGLALMLVGIVPVWLWPTQRPAPCPAPDPP